MEALGTCWTNLPVSKALGEAEPDVIPLLRAMAAAAAAAMAAAAALGLSRWAVWRGDVAADIVAAGTAGAPALDIGGVRKPRCKPCSSEDQFMYMAGRYTAEAMKCVGLLTCNISVWWWQLYISSP
jgi:hypothetical protein